MASDLGRPLEQVVGQHGQHSELDQESGLRPQPNKSFCKQLLMTMGPGLMVCFADTDGSCLITAADSGSKWRYKLLLLQLFLIPVLYFAQELTVRLALVKGKGMTSLLRSHAGSKWAWAVAIPLLIDAFLALISEINVFGQTLYVCWGVPLALTNTLFTLSLLLLALTGSYNVAERVGLAMGVLQVFFFGTMFTAGPDWGQVLSDMAKFPIQDANYVKLITANIGAVIMPWMLAYQQSALVRKGLTDEHGPDHLFIERIDTAVGSFLTQGVMAAMLITVAAVPRFSGEEIGGVDQLLVIFTDAMNGNETGAKILLTFAICGACTVAAIVVTLCGAWALEEALGSDEVRPQPRLRDVGIVAAITQNIQEKTSFYVAYFATCASAWLISTCFSDFANQLTGVWTQFINGLLMPPVIFTLWYLAAYTLPDEYRPGTFYKWMTFVLFGICAIFCLVSIPFAVQDTLFS